MSPIPPPLLRKYATVQNEARLFIDYILKNPARNFGLDTIVKDFHLMRYDPINLRAYPGIIVKTVGFRPTTWAETEGIDETTGASTTGYTAMIDLDIICVLERNAKIVYDGVPYQHIEGGTLDVFESIIAWTLLKNWQYFPFYDDPAIKGWGYRDLVVRNVRTIAGYNGDKTLYAIVFSISLDWEYDVPMDEVM